jgi:hypothetical protein
VGRRHAQNQPEHRWACVRSFVAARDSHGGKRQLAAVADAGQAKAETLLAQAGIDAKEREASDKLQRLILEELHHRIKNTLATVSAIASRSLRNFPHNPLV